MYMYGIALCIELAMCKGELAVFMYVQALHKNDYIYIYERTDCVHGRTNNLYYRISL